MKTTFALKNLEGIEITRIKQNSSHRHKKPRPRRYFAAGRSVTGLPPAPGNRDFAPPEDSP